MNHDHAVPQQILSILNPQFIVEESNGTVVLGRKVGKRTISVRGCQPGRMCVLVVVQGGRDVPLVQSYSFFRDDVTDICLQSFPFLLLLLLLQQLCSQLPAP